MSESDIAQNKELHKLRQILDFPFGPNIPLSKPDYTNSKTITSAVVQGGMKTITTRLKPTKQLSEIEKLDRILNDF